MPKPPEGPSDPLARERKQLRDRIFRLRQHPKLVHNPAAQQEITKYDDLVRGAQQGYELKVVSAGLDDLERRLNS